MQDLISLSELLKYRNKDIEARYTKDFPNNKLSAEQAMVEFLKYLWGGQKLRQDRIQNSLDPDLQFLWSIHPEMQEIDDMWHTFLLFTKDYMDLCQKYFDTYIHHTPHSDEESQRTIESADHFLNVETRRMLSYIYDLFGENTLRVWFSKYFDKN